MFDVHDRNYKTRTYLYHGKEFQFNDFTLKDPPPEVLYRMMRIPPFDFTYDGGCYPYDPAAWNVNKRFIWSCNYASAQGYGMVAENVVTNLKKLGVDVRNPGSVSGNVIGGGEFVTKEALETVGKSCLPDCIEIQHCQPPAIRGDVVERRWSYTMFESDHTPDSWIEMLNNKVERVIVPSKWLVEAWKGQGLKIPVHVYGHGVDPEVYYYLERPDRDTYTFVHWGELSERKGTDLVYKAFTDEFANAKDARLILKCNKAVFFGANLGHPQIEYISATYSKKQMREMLFKADCCVFPTRGEGFGIPPLEAMATGLPTIVTNWSGPADFIDKDDTLYLDYKMVPANSMYMIYKDFFRPDETAGNWAEPSYEQLRYYMRWCYEHRKEAKDMGKKAAERVTREWLWSHKTAEFISLIDSLS